jgi:hypothetical protein
LPDTSGLLRLAEYESTFLPAPIFPSKDQKPLHQEKERGLKGNS